MNFKGKMREKSGITLITLVITIIVLLILAGVTIATLTGDNGLILNAISAKERTEIENEKEIVEIAVVQAMEKNKRGNLVKSELQYELDVITGQGETEVTTDTVDYGYFVKFIDSGRIYKVSRDGDVEYLGKEEELLTQANVIADPESNTTPEFTQTVNLTVETPIDIGDVDFTLVSAWNQDKNSAPADSEFEVQELQGEGRRRTTTVESSASVEGDYYLWVRIVVGDIEKEKCFGPYAIKDHTMLVSTKNEIKTDSGFLGNTNIKRAKIKSINIQNTLNGHSLSDANTWDVTDGNKGKYIAWYTGDETTGYDVTIAGEGRIVANTNSSYLFANIGSGITDTNTEVTITGLENLDTGLTNNMNKMFYSCKAISLNISKFDTSNVTNMQNMFNNCSRLTSLDLSDFDTEKVINMVSMFFGCTNLTTLNLSNFNTKSVINMKEMFRGCKSLTNLDVSKFDTSVVTDMSKMFWDCKSLTKLDLSKFDTSDVTNMHGMFYGCSSLTNLDVSEFDTSNVTNMSAMFMSCAKLTQLTLSNLNTEKVTDIGSMFFGCTNLATLNLSNFDTKSVTSMDQMFRGCSNLTKLDLSNFNTINVTSLDNMFLYVPSNVQIKTNSDMKNWILTNFKSFNESNFN